MHSVCRELVNNEFSFVCCSHYHLQSFLVMSQQDQLGHHSNVNPVPDTHAGIRVSSFTCTRALHSETLHAHASAKTAELNTSLLLSTTTCNIPDLECRHSSRCSNPHRTLVMAPPAGCRTSKHPESKIEAWHALPAFEYKRVQFSVCMLCAGLSYLADMKSGFLTICAACSVLL
jgi:hypothetical protein